MKKIVCLVFLALIPVTSALAVKMSSLYQAELTVPTQTEDLKEQAVQDGFLQVLVKVSGNPQIEDNPVIKSSLQKAAYYVQEYNYLLPTTSSSQYTLQIRYEPDDIIRLLKKAGVAYWREDRPLILVWLAVANNQQPAEVVSDEAPDGILAHLKQQGKKFGLPFIFPVMDVADLNQVSVSDVTEMTLPVLKDAAKRYAPDGMLVGSLEQTEAGVEGHWQLILGEQQWSWTLSQKTTDDMIVDIVNQVSQALVKRYEVKAEESTATWLKLAITNITERDDLKRMLQYVGGLTPVQQVRLLQIHGDTVNVAVLVRGSREAFEQSAVIGQHLALQTQETESEDTLTYEWTP